MRYFYPKGSIYDLELKRLLRPDEAAGVAARRRHSLYGGAIIEVGARGAFNLGAGAHGSTFSGLWVRFGSTDIPSFTVERLGEPLPEGGYGLVLAPPMKVTERSVTVGVLLDPQELRTSALFWDRIVVPDIQGVTHEIGPDGDFLHQEGLITRPKVKITGFMPLSDAIRDGYFQAFQTLSGRDHERWSLARGARTFSVVRDRELIGPSLHFEIIGAIPVPDREVPLPEVLEFKGRRQPELVALQSRLAEVREAIIASPGKALADHPEMIALDAAIADHLKVSREWKFPIRLSNIEAKIDMKSFTGAISGFEYAAFRGGSLPFQLLGGILGGAAASVSAKVGWRKPRDTATPYEYVSSYHRDLFLR